MKLLKELDFIHNKKVNLTLNITAVLLIFPFLALFTWIAILMYGKGSEVFHFFDLFYLLVLMVIHELIHGFFFKVLGDENTKVKFGFKSGMAYATSPGSRYSRKRMLVIILAPFFLISLALTLIYGLHILTATSYIVLASFHAAGCAGDFFLAAAILRQKGDIAVEDTEVGINIYQKENTK